MKETTMQSSRIRYSTDELRSWLTGRVAAQLGMSAEVIRPDVLLAEYGLDSVYALALSTDIEDHLALRLEPTVVWDHPTVDELAAFLLGELENAA
jgi:acyl carrier protein